MKSLKTRDIIERNYQVNSGTKISAWSNHGHIPKPRVDVSWANTILIESSRGNILLDIKPGGHINILAVDDNCMSSTNGSRLMCKLAGGHQKLATGRSFHISAFQQRAVEKP